MVQANVRPVHITKLAIPIAAVVSFPEIPNVEPRYNIAPTQQVAAVRIDEADGQRHLTMLRWGLIPSWATDSKIGNRHINARSETADKTPAFRASFRSRRCLILADGFFEWKVLDGRKQPYYVTMHDDRPFAIAGLWDRWTADVPDRRSVLESCTILTTEANATLKPLHDRMPVILATEAYDRWLDPNVEKTADLKQLIEQYPPNDIRMHTVATLVNNPRNDTIACILPQVEQKSLFDDQI